VPGTAAAPFVFDNSYAKLPDRFYARLDPSPVRAPRLIKLNQQLAEELGLDPTVLAQQAVVEAFAGNQVPPGADPLAMAYAGHQFGNFSPQLGDGRAILLGEVLDRSGQRRDIHLKGSGRTPFSRGGDGRSPLGPALREYIISEAMAALGVPTTRSLAVVATGEPVMREAMEPGGVLTRVATSHIRVGTFQFFAARQDEEALRLLADHVIARHYPAAAKAEFPYLAMLEAVIARQAALIAQWMGLGFIHGVMNTDNMTVSGETIDYGPCAFMDWYNPETVYSSIDRQGRYAYGNQPSIGHWNLVCLTQAMLPLLNSDEEAAVAIAQSAINQYPGLYQQAWLGVMRAKLGLNTAAEGDQALIEDLLARMAANQADWTLTFRYLAAVVDADVATNRTPRDLFIDPTSFDEWAVTWRLRLAEEPATTAEQARLIESVNPLYTPRNHLVQEALAAANLDDLEPFENLIAVLNNPFTEQPGQERYAIPPEPDQIVQATFCGT
jgi:uncharacterized protein YdiU (UPF0061 family)